MGLLPYMFMLVKITALACTLNIAHAADTAGALWPEWRGPGGQGHAQGSGYPMTWDEATGHHLRWRTEIPGRGWSSPVIDQDQVWVTTALEEHADPRRSHAERRRWQFSGLLLLLFAASITASLRFRRHRLGLLAGMALPSLAGSLVLMLLPETQVLRLGDWVSRYRPIFIPKVATPQRLQLQAVAVSLADGRILHRVPVFEIDQPRPIHAFNSYATPTAAIEAGRLYVHFGNHGTACVDTASGSVLWRQQEIQTDYVDGAASSPILWQDLILFQADGQHDPEVVALDKKTGHVRWRSPRSHRREVDPEMQKTHATPLIIQWEGSEVLLSPGAGWLYALDPATGRELWSFRYPDGGYSMAMRPSVAHGLVYVCTAFPRPDLLAIRLPAQGRPAELAWKHQRAVPVMSCPIVTGDEIHFITEGGVLSCLDARTGTLHYKERLPGKFRASPSAAGGQLYWPGLEGTTHVLPIGPRFSPGQQGTLRGSIQASPAFTQDSILMRTDTALYRLQR